MAQQILKHLTAGPERRITMESILRAVAERFSIAARAAQAKTNTQQIAYPRQIAMYLVKELTHASLPEIGRILAANITPRCFIRSRKSRSCASGIRI